MRKREGGKGSEENGKGRKGKEEDRGRRRRDGKIGNGIGWEEKEPKENHAQNVRIHSKFTAPVHSHRPHHAGRCRDCRMGQDFGCMGHNAFGPNNYWAVFPLFLVALENSLKTNIRCNNGLWIL